LSISNTTRRAGPFACNGSTTAFPFTFKVFLTSDVVVTLTDVNGNLTVLNLGTDYSVSLNSNQDSNPGGTVNTTASWATGYSITLTSGIPALQSVVLTNTGGFYPDVLNGELDRLTILIQQVSEIQSRTPYVPVSSPAGISLALPFPQATQVIGWDATGLKLTSYNISSQISAASASLLSSGLYYGATSTTSITIATGSISFTASLNSMLAVGQAVTMASTASPTNFMTGQITAYNPTSGAMTINVTSTGGSGTFAAWTISMGTAGQLTTAGGTMLGRLVAVASATGAAGFNIPHGAAPTAPVNGDIWSTTKGFYGQINGVTIGPFLTTRIASTVSAATITPNCDITTQHNVTALAVAATFAIPTGTATDGQKLMIRIKDNGTAQALTWTTSAGGYRIVGSTLPTTTVANKLLYIGCIYNAADAFWDVVAVNLQA